MAEDDSSLRLAYEQTVAERDRLRGARAHFARQLGPLPAFAGVSVAFVGAFAEDVERDAWLVAAFGMFALLILLSTRYSGLPAYRQLRAQREGEWRARLERESPDLAARARDEGLRVEDLLGEREWYAAQIGLERELIGDSGERNRLLAPRRDLVRGTLVDQLDRERTGVLVGQALFLVVIGCLLAAHL